MDSEGRAKAARHGVTLSELTFVDPFFAYYDSGLLKKRNPAVPADRLARDIAEYKRLGVRILAVYPPTLQSEVYAAHPDWRRVPTDTAEVPSVDLKTTPHGGMLCPLGPYGDFFVDVLAEILTKHPDVDAFSFDGLHHGGVCYCKHCRENYRKDTGKAIPRADLDDADFRRYQHWADRRLEDLIRRMQTRLKGIKPEVALVTWTTNAGRFGHFLSLPRNMPSRMNLLFDAPDQEFWMDETNRGATVVPAFANAYLWATTNHRVGFSEPYLMSHGNPYSKDSFPPEELRRRMLLAATWRAVPSLAVLQPPRLQPQAHASLDEVRRLKPWLVDRRPEPWAALLMSDNTRTFYGRSPGKVEERYLGPVLGTFRACLEGHLPTTVVNDWNLTPADLAPYRVLLLPNAACLDDQQAKAVREFVAAGGGLVAGLDASRFDEFGDARAGFALADVFGVTHRGPAAGGGGPAEVDPNFAKAIGPDYWEKHKGVFDFRVVANSPLDAGRMRDLVGTEAVTFKGPAVRVAPGKGAEVWGTLRPRTRGMGEFPAIVAREFGKGRAVFLAAGLDAAYYRYPYPYQRVALSQSIRWAAREGPPVAVEAPMCVHATVMRQRVGDGERLLVNLFNDVNTAAGHALPDDDVPLREETLPIHDVRSRGVNRDKGRSGGSTKPAKGGPPDPAPWSASGVAGPSAQPRTSVACPERTHAFPSHFGRVPRRTERYAVTSAGSSWRHASSSFAPVLSVRSESPSPRRSAWPPRHQHWSSWPTSSAGLPSPPSSSWRPPSPAVQPCSPRGSTR
jgi:hypothetical protein